MGRYSYLCTLWREGVAQRACTLLVLTGYAVLCFARDEIIPYGVERHWWTPAFGGSLTVFDIFGILTWHTWLVVSLMALTAWSFESAYRSDYKRLSSIRALTPVSDLTVSLSPQRQRFDKYEKLVQSTLPLRVENNSDHNIENCQIFVRVFADRNNFPVSPNVEFRSCAPFDLRPDEGASIDVLHFDYDVSEPDLKLYNWFQLDGDWQKYPSGTSLPFIGNYTFAVQVRADNTRAAKSTVRAECTTGRWGFTTPLTDQSAEDLTQLRTT